MKFIKRYLAPCISGVMLGTSYIPFFPWASLFAWVPLWYFIIQQRQLKRVLIGAWLCQFIAVLIGFNWVAYTINTFGNMPWVVAILGLFLFALLSNIFIVIASALWFLITKQYRWIFHTPSQLILLPFLFALLHMSIIFPWSQGELWFWAGLPASQTAEIWGFRFLDTLVYVFNFLILVISRHRWSKEGQLATALLVFCFIFINVFGLYLKKRLPPTDKTLNFIMVQSNVGQLAKLKLQPSFRNRFDQAYFKIKNLTYKAAIQLRDKYKRASDVDFILWSEGSLPYSINSRQKTMPLISRLIKDIHIPLITGVSVKKKQGYMNSIVIFDRKAQIQRPTYNKRKLIPFGEYIPLSSYMPFLKKLFPYMHGQFEEGKSNTVSQLGDVRFGFQICYESLFPKDIRSSLKQEPHVFVNVTNDSWFGWWQEPWQHLIQSAGRGLEFRRPFIRATSTGISTVIQHDGTVLEQSPIRQPWVHFYSVPYYSQPLKTFFMSWGFYIKELFLFCLLLISLAWNHLRKRS